jgi:hypothetical protein
VVIAKSEVISRHFQEGIGEITINLSKIVTRCLRAKIRNRYLRTTKMTATCSSRSQLLGEDGSGTFLRNVAQFLEEAKRCYASCAGNLHIHAIRSSNLAPVSGYNTCVVMDSVLLGRRCVIGYWFPTLRVPSRVPGSKKNSSTPCL